VIVDATAVNEVVVADVAAVAVTVAAGGGTAVVIGGPVVEVASTVVELSDVELSDAELSDEELSDADVSDAGTELAAPLVWSGAWTSLAHPAAISSSAMIDAHLGDVSLAVRQRTGVGVFCLTICDRSPRASAMGERLRSVSQMIEMVEMFEAPPQAEEFCALRVAAGLSQKFGFSVPAKSTGMYLTTWPGTVG